MVTSTDRVEERTERSRNAKAQARHRAKRKAYIDHLEQTVARLQAIVGLPSADPADSPLARLRDLEAENARLRAENATLHRRLVDQDEANSSAARTFQDATRVTRQHQPPPLLMPLYTLASPVSEQRSPGTSSTSSSAASPFSSSSSPLTLPGLKLPPTQPQTMQPQQQPQPESPSLTSPASSPYAQTTTIASAAYASHSYGRNTYEQRGAFDLKPDDGISSYASSAYGMASPAMTTPTTAQPPHSYALYSPHDLWGGHSRVHVVGRS